MSGFSELQSPEPPPIQCQPTAQQADDIDSPKPDDRLIARPPQKYDISYPGEEVDGVVTSQPTGDDIPRDVGDTQRTSWGTGLFNCFDDTGICVKGLSCCCCLVHDVAEAMGESNWLACCPLSVVPLRAKYRQRRNIKGHLLLDCLAGVFCGMCAACQLGRELRVSSEDDDDDDDGDGDCWGLDCCEDCGDFCEVGDCGDCCDCSD